ncbi:phage protein Gp36 family protein [Flavobacterium aestivum]|uniref:phage protein Gp36 family protein n=1 Tax=Flavobacterium aestivum TaxID=3003257 RepID=UPI002286130D|nr:phage protein Gp36 family protein [Flavobacterium aestivum]
MYLVKEELGSVMYGYQIDQITEGNNLIVTQAISAAIGEVKSYLTGNNKKEWIDGRYRYDVAAIFSAEGDTRNATILEITKTVAKWWICQLCNADMIYEQCKERYDRAIDWLTKLAKGTVNLDELPQIDMEVTQPDKQPFSYGSRAKFNHE